MSRHQSELSNCRHLPEDPSVSQHSQRLCCFQLAVHLHVQLQAMAETKVEEEVGVEVADGCPVRAA